MNWNYMVGGSFSTTGMAAAMGAWNASQGYTTFSQGGYDDIAISDDSSIPGLGESIRHNDSASGCYLHPSSACSWFCNNLSRLYYEELKLNPTVIASTASTFSLSQDTVVQQVVSHEIGHVFGLADYDDGGTPDCTDSTIMSSDESFNCGFTSADM